MYHVHILMCRGEVPLQLPPRLQVEASQLCVLVRFPRESHRRQLKHTHTHSGLVTVVLVLKSRPSKLEFYKLESTPTVEMVDKRLVSGSSPVEYSWHAKGKESYITSYSYHKNINSCTFKTFLLGQLQILCLMKVHSLGASTQCKTP